MTRKTFGTSLISAILIGLAVLFGQKTSYAQDNGMVSIQKFGVLPNNSAQVNKKNLQKAIDWAAKSGSALYVTPVEGGYEVATGVILKKKCISYRIPWANRSRHLQSK